MSPRMNREPRANHNALSIRRSPRVLIALTVACSLGLAASGATAATLAAEGDLPISSITLYRSGVGYFERLGRVDGDASLQLHFATEQVNDILKSMVVLDLGGGSIESVRYGSQEPLERRLASFAIDVSNAPSMEDLLAQLRGAPVRVWTPEGVVEGTVMGVETRTEQIDRTTVSHPFVNLLTPDGLRSVGLHTATNMQIADPVLAAELAKALGALAEHRADNTKSVDLSLRGSGGRDIFVSYIHEMPVWKASYRLVLPSEGAGATSASDRPTLQGWAIVENNTDEDWQHVNLSLVAGQPVSFTMDLYQPLYVRRPELPVPVAAGVAPRNYEGGIVTAGSDDSPLQSSTGAAYDRAPEMDLSQLLEKSRAAPGSAGRAAGEGKYRATLGVDALAEYGPQALASAAESGEVFLFRLDAPVTIERRQSAMLPILSSPIDGERISIYSAADGPKHPMRGVRLVNNTGLQLMPGPISVFDGSAYAGDATISHVPAGDSRLLAYAVDLEVEASTKHAPSSRSLNMHLVNGVLVTSYELEDRIEHTFTNKDTGAARTIVIEHPRDAAWELVTPEKPDETTDSLFRFRLSVAPGGSQTLAITQRRTDRQEIAIAAVDLDTMLLYQKQGRVSQAVLDAYKEAARLRDLVDQSQRRIDSATREIASIADDQSRIRQNMGGIDKASQLYARYVQKLDEQETTLETLRKVLAESEAERERRQAAYADYIRTLNVE